MKHKLFFLATAFLLVNCKADKEVDVDYVTSRFAAHAAKRNKVELNMRRIDTFSDGDTWDNRGYALLEKDESDIHYGMSFYGDRFDYDKVDLYEDGMGFDISWEEQTYVLEGPNSIIGSTGGQMVLQNVFELDSVYEEVILSETDDRYILKYLFEDDTTYNVTDITKVVELQKSDFFPVKVSRTSRVSGTSGGTWTMVQDYRINEEVTESIAGYKEKIRDFKAVQAEGLRQSPLVNKKLPEITLPRLTGESEMLTISPGKLTLVEFWQVWCGWCIKAIPEVERLKNKYPELQVVGIVTDKEEAVELMNKKGGTYTNLLASTSFLEDFGIVSFPTFFLVDQEGIVQKQYNGFKEEMEADIREYLQEDRSNGGGL